MLFLPNVPQINHEARSLFFFCALALILFTTAPAHAQQGPDRGLPNVTFQVGGGATVPVSPSEFTDLMDTDFNLTGGIGIPLTQELEVTFSVTYNDFPLAGDLDDLLGPDDDVDFTILAGEANLKYNFPVEASVMPYLTAGGGVYNSEVTISAAGFSESDSETDVGVNVGAGLSFPFANNVGFFVEPRYTIVFSEGDNIHYLPIRAGITLTN